MSNVQPLSSSNPLKRVGSWYNLLPSHVHWAILANAIPIVGLAGFAAFLQGALIFYSSPASGEGGAIASTFSILFLIPVYIGLVVTVPILCGAVLTKAKAISIVSSVIGLIATLLAIAMLISYMVD